jgi:hypothetical protein
MKKGGVAGCAGRGQTEPVGLGTIRIHLDKTGSSVILSESGQLVHHQVRRVI